MDKTFRIFLASALFILAGCSKAPPEIAVDQYHSTCDTDSDCTFVMTRCSCQCYGKPLNFIYKSEYQKRLDHVCEGYDGPICDMDCLEQEIRCIQGTCTSVKHNATFDDIFFCASERDCVIVPYDHCCGSTRIAINYEFLAEYRSNPSWQVYNETETCAVMGVCPDDTYITDAYCDMGEGTGRCALVR